MGTVQNSVWFGLRHGGYHEKALQAEWNVHSEAAFEYEILEKLDELDNSLTFYNQNLQNEGVKQIV